MSQDHSPTRKISLVSLERQPAHSEGCPLILVVDDEPGLLEVMALGLEMHGYRVVTASNGKVALEVLDQCEVDFVVSDIRMPEVDGLELLSQLRKRSEQKLNQKLKVPQIILMTGYSGLTREEALMNGALEMLMKPFLLDELLSILDGPLVLTK